MIEIEAPDGTIIEFPEGTADDVITNVMMQSYGEQPTEQLPTIPKLEAIGQGMKRSFNPFADEMEAAGAAVGGELGEFIGTRQPEEMGQRYEQALARKRAQFEEAEKQRPDYTLGGEVIGGLGLVGATAPLGGIRALQAMGKAAPYASAAGLGALSGGVYGFGTGEGGAEERARRAAMGAGLGSAGGVVGASLGRLADRTLRTLARKRGANVGGDVMEVPQPKEVSEIMEQGAATKMTRGAREQDIDLMRKEEMARQGLLGGELQSQIGLADEIFEQDVKNVARSLAGKDVGETSQDTLTRAVGMVKNRYDAEKKLASSLMNKRNEAIAKSKIYKEYTKNTLGESFDDLKKTPDFEVNLSYRGNEDIAKDFKVLDKLMSGKDDAINMGMLSAWRRGLNQYKPSTQEGALSAPMKATYDEWLDGLVKTAFKEGDDDMVEKIFKANKNYSEFKTKYGTNKYIGQKNIIERLMTEEEMTPRAMVNTVFGKSLDGKDYTEQYVKRMIDVMPEGAKREGVKDGFRAGLYQKAFENSYDDVTETLKLGKLKKNLTDLIKSDSYKNHLMTEEHDALTRSLIEDIGKIQRSQEPDIRNVSGTAPFFGRFAQSIGALPIVRNVSLARGAAEGVADIAKAGKNATTKRQLEKEMANYYKAISPILDDNISFNFGAPVAGGAIAAQAKD